MDAAVSTASATQESSLAFFRPFLPLFGTIFFCLLSVGASLALEVAALWPASVRRIAAIAPFFKSPTYSATNRSSPIPVSLRTIERKRSRLLG